MMTTSNTESGSNTSKLSELLETIFRDTRGVYVDEMEVGIYHISFAVEADGNPNGNGEGSSYGAHIYADVNVDPLDLRVTEGNVDHENGGHAKPCREVPEPYRSRLRSIYWMDVACPLLRELPNGVEARVGFPNLKCNEYILRIRLSAPNAITEDGQEGLEAVALHGSIGDALRTKVGGVRTCEAEVIEV